ncbi:MAG: MATE family efflux transporter, partial [Deltaproteobacteria bacterium]|nr:MATE family efflux transporter [Deltaproteobacteria bacterium]
YEIVFQLFIFCSDTIDGLAVAGQTLVARHLGAGDVGRARRLGRMLLVWGCAGGAVFGAAYLTLQEPLLALFTASEAVKEVVRTEAFLLLAVFQPLNGIAFALDGFILGAHDTRFLMWAMLAGGLLLFVPLTGLAYQLELGLFGVWAGFSLFMVQRVAANLWRLFSRRWEGAFAAYHAGRGG